MRFIQVIRVFFALFTFQMFSPFLVTPPKTPIPSPLFPDWHSPTLGHRAFTGPIASPLHRTNEAITPGMFLGYPSLSKLKQYNWKRVNLEITDTLQLVSRTDHSLTYSNLLTSADLAEAWLLGHAMTATIRKLQIWTAAVCEVFASGLSCHS